MTSQTTVKRFVLKKSVVIMGTIAIFVVSIIAIGAVRYIQAQPSNHLGPRMELIGKHYFGCPGFCDSELHAKYYYATDLNEEGVKHYFKGAVFEDEMSVASADYNYPTLSFTSKGQDFSLSYYDNAAFITHEFHLKPTAKPHVISIVDDDYAVARTAF